VLIPATVRPKAIPQDAPGSPIFDQADAWERAAAGGIQIAGGLLLLDGHAPSIRYMRPARAGPEPGG